MVSIGDRHRHKRRSPLAPYYRIFSIRLISLFNVYVAHTNQLRLRQIVANLCILQDHQQQFKFLLLVHPFQNQNLNPRQLPPSFRGFLQELKFNKYHRGEKVDSIAMIALVFLNSVVVITPFCHGILDYKYTLSRKLRHFWMANSVEPPSPIHLPN